MQEHIQESLLKIKKNESDESAFTAERNLFKYNEKILKEIIGKLEIIKKEPENELIIQDNRINFGPKIIIYPSFAPTLLELNSKLNEMKKQ